MLNKIRKLKITYLSGLLGTIFICTGSVLSALAYSGPTQESYSILNHFISELGVLQFSKNAYFFNYGLILGGSFLMIMFLSLSTLFETSWRWLLLTSGTLCSIFCILVGVFPADQLKAHISVSLPFFNLALLSSLLFIIITFLDKGKNIPLKIGLSGVIPLTALSAFLFDRILHRNQFQMAHLQEALLHRKNFWSLPFLEWLVFIGILIWVIVVCSWSYLEDRNSAS